jgi:hypothetical protein
MSGQGLDLLREAIAERVRQNRAAAAAPPGIESPATFGAPA